MVRLQFLITVRMMKRNRLRSIPTGRPACEKLNKLFFKKVLTFSKFVIYYNCSKGEHSEGTKPWKQHTLLQQDSKKLRQKFEKPLDKHQILWYNKDVPRDRDELQRS